MYEDFYPYIPGSLDARQRVRKLRLRRLYYGLGALAVFGSGFLLGLEWREPDAALTQTALQDHRQIEAALTPPVATLPPPAELATPSLEPQSTPASEPAPQAVSDADADQQNMITEADPPQLSSLILGSATTALNPHRQDQAPVKMQAKAASRLDTHKPDVVKPKMIKPKVVKKTSRKPQKQTQPPRPYLVQVGAFQNEANARSIVERLRAKGYQPFIRKVKNGQNRVLHRVFIDRAKDKAQAQATAKAFEATEKMDALVMLAGSLSDASESGSR